tara:strand:- start:2068 stop:3105 length:1038 start_codon:yes stop_codon:yes gene_type:complete
MARTRDFLKNLVASRIDEVIPVGTLVQGQTAIEDPLGAIEDELDFSAEYVLRVGSIDLLFPTIETDMKYFHNDTIEIDRLTNHHHVTNQEMMVRIESDNSVTIPVPEDFVRFVSLKFTGAKKRVTELLSSEDQEYRELQNNPYFGTRYKPKAALISFSEYDTDTDFIHNNITANSTGHSADKLLKKYTISTNSSSVPNVFSTNQVLTTLNNSHNDLTTNGRILLEGQTDGSENGIYVVNASGAPTKISDNFNRTTTSALGLVATGTVQNTAIHYFSAASASDRMEHFHYIRRTKAQDMPDTLTDLLVYHCAGRVLESLQRPQEAQIMYQKANTYLTVYNDGLIGK